MISTILSLNATSAKMSYVLCEVLLFLEKALIIQIACIENFIFLKYASAYITEYFLAYERIFQATTSPQETVFAHYRLDVVQCSIWLVLNMQDSSLRIFVVHDQYIMVLI